MSWLFYIEPSGMIWRAPLVDGWYEALHSDGTVKFRVDRRTAEILVRVTALPDVDAERWLTFTGRWLLADTGVV